ncbi:MAG: hypothetical protein EF806_04290 [Candidatus Methanoliparum thermophilum]|uniref:Acyltransferase n=1 Tax=Methanoliparum thermophilum TaxID=2491083 RepID=A0A520KS21_METT2|nr:polymer-forming cytoskeletal protein [Candidatus Methanoliparum sp. LAM-1]RZN64565.1 MAG: hypothetical protein EF806_04290 [Candidatus Methanoliparum thermophilum]BDC35836.1 hypothetical protein MTLP_05180 [Candidatus Methanoliparum sp. LAM-1]
MIKKMIIPNDTSINDDVIICNRDMIICSYSEIHRGLIGENIFIGDMVNIKGGIRTYNDLRVGYFSILSGDVYVDGDAYLSDRIKINGKLVLGGNLDIGDDVRIDGGFESKGWIIIRDPIPFILFIFLYLSVILRIHRKSIDIDLSLNGNSYKDADDIKELSSLDFTDVDKNSSRLDIFLCPESTYIGEKNLIVDTSLEIGERCSIYCSIDADNVFVKKGSVIDGDIVSHNDIIIEEDSKVRGNLKASGRVIINKNATIFGKIKAKEIIINPDFVES